MSVRSIQGETYCAKSGRKFTGQIKEKFMIIDWTLVLAGSYSFTWLSWQVHRSLAVLFKGSAVEPFDLEFRKLYASSKPVPAFLTVPTEFNLTRPLITHQAAATSTPLTNLPRPSPGTTTQNRYSSQNPTVQPTTTTTAQLRSSSQNPTVQPTTTTTAQLRSSSQNPKVQPTTTTTAQLRSSSQNPTVQPTTTTTAQLRSSNQNPTVQPTTTTQQTPPNTQPTAPPTSQQRHPNTQQTAPPTSQQRHPNTQPTAPPTSQQRHPNTQPTAPPTSQCLVNQFYYTGPRSNRFDWITQRHTATRPVMFQRSFSSDYSTGDNLAWRPFNSNYLLYGGTTGLLDRHPLLKTGQWFTVPK
uniref:Family with sequence similarity 83 member A n=1 Tax=Hucho hucho TaxID=62062 RepID=A0A4W5K917_9TELE